MVGEDNDELVPGPSAEMASRETASSASWVFDIERERMIAANTEALRLWSADDIDELLARDFASDMSGATRARLAAYLTAFQRGESIVEVWTLYPLGTPITALCQCSPVALDDGRTGMRVEVIDDGPAFDPGSLRSLAAVQHAPTLLSIYDEDGHVVLRNTRAIQALGAGGFFGDHFEDPQAGDALRQAAQREGWARSEMYATTTNGRRYHLVEAQLARDPVSARPLIVTYEYDDTDRQELRHSLATDNALLHELVDRLPMAILIEDQDRCVRHVNQAFCRLFDLHASPSELVGSDCRTLLNEVKHNFVDPDTLGHRIDAILGAHRPVADDELPMVDGRMLTRTYQPIVVAGGYRGHLWQYEDVTGRRETEDGLRYNAEHDWLTGLLNRRSTDASLAARQARMQSDADPATLLLVDVDHFKDVNDRFGHPLGDRLLVQLAQAFRAVLRPSDVIGRFGGEEFVILLPDTPKEEGRAVAERVRVAAAEWGCQRPDGETVTVSVGMTEMTATDPDETAAIARADAALYDAKRAGRDRVAERLAP